MHEPPPDHSTVSRTRRLIDLETHQAVFTWVLQRLADAQLVKGRTLGIDATTLEANAALRSIVRRDTGEECDAWLTRLAAASGIATPTRAELARFDRKRKKKGANDDWTNPHDPDANITKLQDGHTHLAHTAEHAVDLETGAVVGVTVQDAADGDTTTMVETLITAAEQVEAVLPAAAGRTEVVGDKGYHSNDTMVAFADLGIRSYVSEPDRGRRNWKGKAAAREAVYANRRRIRGTRGQRLLRQRGERLERPNAHLYETGRMRRVHLRGHPNILKRVLVHICGFNLGLLMRQLTGIGTPRSLQGRAAAAFDALMASRSQLWTLVSPTTHDCRWDASSPASMAVSPPVVGPREGRRSEVAPQQDAAGVVVGRPPRRADQQLDAERAVVRIACLDRVVERVPRVVGERPPVDDPAVDPHRHRLRREGRRLADVEGNAPRVGGNEEGRVLAAHVGAAAGGRLRRVLVRPETDAMRPALGSAIVRRLEDCPPVAPRRRVGHPPVHREQVQHVEPAARVGVPSAPGVMRVGPLAGHCQVEAVPGRVGR